MQWYPVMAAAAAAFPRERQAINVQLAAAARTQGVGTTVGAAASAGAPVSPGIADWVAFGRVFLTAHAVCTAAVRDLPLSVAVVGRVLVPGSSPAAAAGSGGLISGAAVAENVVDEEMPPALPKMQRYPSQLTRSEATTTRARVAAAVCIHADWNTLELWPYFNAIHRETWALPKWLVPGQSDPAISPSVQRLAQEGVIDETVAKDMLLDSFVALGCTSLIPYKTRPDGDCFSHALSTAMWGVSDHPSLMRHLMQLVYDPGNKASERIKQQFLLSNQRIAVEMCRREKHKECPANRCLNSLDEEDWEFAAQERNVSVKSWFIYYFFNVRIWFFCLARFVAVSQVCRTPATKDAT